MGTLSIRTMLDLRAVMRILFPKNFTDTKNQIPSFILRKTQNRLVFRTITHKDLGK